MGAEMGAEKGAGKDLILSALRWDKAVGDYLGLLGILRIPML
jgi:hypothetical protein